MNRGKDIESAAAKKCKRESIKKKSALTPLLLTLLKLIWETINTRLYQSQVRNF